ncbi:hypothetical protein PDESU_06217 [Pontiella desulfatans]|uniref:Uncharacterized protein n=1 Tax=Pontiella desulfatans TaxID=2750659 RepID=A0A6C2UEH5_PONDE|nr:hypothetical protein PDESU_06217 [Pontiella desulfatans]
MGQEAPSAFQQKAIGEKVGNCTSIQRVEIVDIGVFEGEAA